MKLASHNTFTYLKVRQWWLRPFAFTARCQRKDIWEQLIYGARMFDLRVRFRDGKPVIAHGLMEYKMKREELSRILNELNESTSIHMRVTLENNNPDMVQREGFYFFCLHLHRDYPNIKFFGGTDRKDWESPIYNFGQSFKIDHEYSSATSRFSKGPRWLRFIDDLYPIGYAKRYNQRNKWKEGQEWIMVDFVDIG